MLEQPPDLTLDDIIKDATSIVRVKSRPIRVTCSAFSSIFSNIFADVFLLVVKF